MPVEYTCLILALLNELEDCKVKELQEVSDFLYPVYSKADAHTKMQDMVKQLAYFIQSEEIYYK